MFSRFINYFKTNITPILILLLTATLIGYSTFKKSTKVSHFRKGVLVLSKKNTIVFRDVVTERSTSAAVRKALELSNNLDDSKTPLYLYLDTPGGSIVAGMDLINSLKALPREVKTVSNFAASMGFQIAQNMGERYVTPTGVLMSHRAYMGLEGQTPGEFESRQKLWEGMLRNMDQTAAERLGMDFDAYRALIKDEFWVSGQEAVDRKAADKVTLVTCDNSLKGTYDETIMTIFGDIKIKWSECPLVTFPVSIDFSELEKKNHSQTDIIKVKELIIQAIYYKRKIATSSDLLEYIRTVK